MMERYGGYEKSELISQVYDLEYSAAGVFANSRLVFDVFNPRLERLSDPKYQVETGGYAENTNA